MNIVFQRTPINSLEAILIAYVVGALTATAFSLYGKWCARAK
jgi:hypothetical protein